MTERKGTQNVRTTSASKNAADTLNYKGHAEDGVFFLTSSTGTATGLFHAFVVGSEGCTISDITFHPDVSLSKQDIGEYTTYEWNPNGYFPFPPFTSITITSGSIMLCKHEPR